MHLLETSVYQELSIVSTCTDVDDSTHQLSIVGRYAQPWGLVKGIKRPFSRYSDLNGCHVNKIESKCLVNNVVDTYLTQQISVFDWIVDIWPVSVIESERLINVIQPVLTWVLLQVVEDCIV